MFTSKRIAIKCNLTRTETITSYTRYLWFSGHIYSVSSVIYHNLQGKKEKSYAVYSWNSVNSVGLLPGRSSHWKQRLWWRRLASSQSCSQDRTQSWQCRAPPRHPEHFDSSAGRLSHPGQKGGGFTVYKASFGKSEIANRVLVVMFSFSDGLNLALFEQKSFWFLE